MKHNKKKSNTCINCNIDTDVIVVFLFKDLIQNLCLTLHILNVQNEVFLQQWVWAHGLATIKHKIRKDLTKPNGMTVPFQYRLPGDITDGLMPMVGPTGPAWYEGTIGALCP